MGEVVYHPVEAFGSDLKFAESLDVSGQLTSKHLKKFANARRTLSMGPTAIYYSGVTAPAVSAGMGAIVHMTLSDFGWPANWTHIATLLLSAMAGISWYIVFMRLSARDGYGRDGETRELTHISIAEDGIHLSRGHVATHIGWDAVRDVKTSSAYIALIVDGANDVLMPKEWFDGKEGMLAAAKKLAALRPPPFDG